MSYTNRYACCIPTDDNITKPNSNGCSKRNACHYLSTNQYHDGISNSCSNIVIKTGKFGLHAISSRYIKAGTIIVQCLPISQSILIPPGTSILDESDEDDRRRICVRCFIREGESSNNGRKKKFGRCSKCRVLYYCSRSCQSADWNEQHKLECSYYVKRRKQLRSNSTYNAGSSSAEDDAIPLLLRTFNSLKYMRDKEEEVSEVSIDSDRDINQSSANIVSCGRDHFASLCYTMNNGNDRDSSSSMTLAKEIMSKYACRGSSSSKQQEDPTKSTLGIWGYNESNTNNDNSNNDKHGIKRTMSAFTKNNFGIVNSLHSAIGEGVYPCAALLNHSCYPNCILRYKLGKTMNDSESGSSEGQQKYHPPILQIVACRDILAGEELCHSYVDLALTTPERQTRLFDTHGFKCECERCTKGCLVDLPIDRQMWELWPLKNGLQSHEDDKNSSQTSVPMRLVDIEDAMNSYHGLSESQMMQINYQSQVLQQQASQAMVAGDATGEVQCLKQAIELYWPARCSGNGMWFSPFYSHLYTVRCLYLSALLANGQIEEALSECEHIVSFLAVAFGHVEKHPLLGLQLFTLGDLYSGINDSVKAKLAYTWARNIMRVSHGESDPMVQALNENIAAK